MASAVASPPSKRRRMEQESVPLTATSSTTDFTAPPPLAVSDLDFAFDLQMQEAIAASIDSMAGQEEIARSGRPCKAEIIEIPDEEGESVTSPPAIRDLGLNEYFRLCSKGLRMAEGKNEAKLGAAAVAVFNSSDAVPLETSEPLELNNEVAELEEGLEVAHSLEMKSVEYSCLHSNLYPCLHENQKPKDAKVAELVKCASDLMKRFLGCHLSRHKTNAPDVVQLAKSSTEKQDGKPCLTKVNCPICLEDVDLGKIFKTCHRRRHQFCSSCLQKYIEFKLRRRELPRCPQSNCRKKLSYSVCKRFLALEMHDMFDQLFKEASIPAYNKVYCPDLRCSKLMSKTEALANITRVESASKAELYACGSCVKCRSLLCVNCRVMWHSNMSCRKYKKRELDYLDDADVKLITLAREMKWRQCPSCSHMIVALGCNHIRCRCGHEFCYVCGSEWKNKKATCSCALWSEENLLLAHRR